MSTIEVRHIAKQFPGVTALKDVSFSVEDGEFFVLLGPTGAGKTTTLRVIAGLERQEGGHVLFDGRRVDHLTPADRDVAFVFQQYSLYPTMTVFDNLAFPLRAPLRRLSKKNIKKRVEDAAGNAVTRTIAATPRPKLYQPARAARLRRAAPTTFAWEAVPKATYYNFQLHRRVGGRWVKVLTRWPGKAPSGGAKRTAKCGTV